MIGSHKYEKNRLKTDLKIDKVILQRIRNNNFYRAQQDLDTR